ncbi:cytidylate kinase-like family protein [Marispirochaeta aestuarii]|uniref:cytidylate kinase-like family protein n=1 Tax=Marispirochaeta aestuarii TaxID=1963862 RepID=UPI0029C67991|nr:cytidylate kinase-like family protein [Marispirochaeta aestuarii]
MAVICISRELAANGEETARELTKINGYRFIEREFIESRMLEKKIEPQDIRHFDEHKPGPLSLMPERRLRFLQILKEIILDEASKGNCIILGRGAGAILQGIPGIVSVRLIAPHDVRIHRIKLAHKCDERTAEHQIRQSDHDRRGFLKYFFDLNWQDGDIYDLTVNTASLNPAGTALLIDKYRELTVSSADEKLGIQRMRDRKIEAAVITEIIYTRKIRVQGFSAVMDKGRLILNGVASSREEAREAEAAVRGIEGVEALDNQIAVLPHATAS